MQKHGALVGWTHQDMGGRVMLKIESYENAETMNQSAPDQFRLFMTKQQAAVLGNYLMDISGETGSRRGQRSLFKRLFG